MNRALLDWYADGHYIMATAAADAARECVRLYGHQPATVREWDAEHDSTVREAAR